MTPIVEKVAQSLFLHNNPTVARSPSLGVSNTQADLTPCVSFEGFNVHQHSDVTWEGSVQLGSGHFIEDGEHLVHAQVFDSVCVDGTWYQPGDVIMVHQAGEDHVKARVQGYSSAAAQSGNEYANTFWWVPSLIQ